MAGPPVSPTDLAWQWVIETLAEIEQVDTSILKELITRWSDHFKSSAFGAAAKERVSLRYLEECIVSTHGAFAGGASSNTSLSTTADGLTLSVPEGSNGAIDVAQSSEDVLCRYLQKVATLSKMGKSIDVLCRNELHHFILQKRAALPKSSLDLLKDKLLKDCYKSFSYLMESGGLVKANQVEHLPTDTRDEDDGAELLNSTKGHDNMPSSPDLVHVDALLPKDFSKHGHCSSEATGCQTDLIDTNGNNILPRDGPSISSAYKNKRSEVGPSDGSKQNGHPDSHQNICLDHEQSVVPDSLSNEDASSGASPEFEAYNEILASEKQKLVSSQNPSNHDSLTESQQLCIKCDEDGQLLFCSASDCPIAVHESCLGSNVSVDDTGVFYCPFCSYECAATAYRDAREKVSLARKTLSSFMGWDQIHKKKAVQPAPTSKVSSPKKHVKENHPRKVNVKRNREETDRATAQQKQGKGFVDDISDDSLKKAEGPNLTNRNYVDSQIMYEVEIINKQQDILSDEYRREINVVSTCHSGLLTCNGLVKSTTTVNDGISSSKGELERGHGIEQHQLEKNAQKSVADNLLHDETDASRVRDLHYTSNLERSKGTEDHCKAKSSTVHYNLPFSKETCSPILEDNAETEKQGSAPIWIPAQGINSSSREHKNSTKRAKRYSNPIFPYARRNRLPWTTEEVEFLKDAVEKFSDSDKGSIPWTEILEHGRHIFHKTRQPADLKDKMRNIRIQEGKR